MIPDNLWLILLFKSLYLLLIHIGKTRDLDLYSLSTCSLCVCVCESEN